MIIQVGDKFNTLKTFVDDIYINAGHAGQPHQPFADKYRGGGHADHGGVHPLQCTHVHHEGQIRDL